MRLRIQNIFCTFAAENVFEPIPLLPTAYKRAQNEDE